MAQNSSKMILVLVLLLACPLFAAEQAQTAQARVEPRP